MVMDAVRKEYLHGGNCCNVSEMIAKNIDSALGSKWYGMIAELKNTNSRESHEEKQYWLFLSSSQTPKGIPCKTLNHNGWSVGKTRSTDT